MGRILKKGSGGDLRTSTTSPEPEALTASRAVGAESLVDVSDSSGESPILQVSATEIARIRTLATEILDLVTRLEPAAPQGPQTVEVPTFDSDLTDLIDKHFPPERECAGRNPVVRESGGVRPRRVRA